MSETSDYDPGPWKGHDFKEARKTYDDSAGRSYEKAVSSNKSNAELLPQELTTDSESPLVIVCDVTGSMGDWPATIFSKLPYLDKEGQEYLGRDLEICFAAVGDVFCDKYPLQARPFTKGTALKDELAKLVIEGGGGDSPESYDMAALYFARNVKMLKAFRPILIFIGDEVMHGTVDRERAKAITYADPGSRGTVRSIFEELTKKYSVYYIRKGGSDQGRDETHETWAKLIGEDHICTLPEASRVVDVIFGILAKETDRVPYFKEELTGRQKPDQVNMVMKSLETIHELRSGPATKKPDGKSVTRGRKPDGGKASKGLI